jgi:hypothetical protein
MRLVVRGKQVLVPGEYRVWLRLLVDAADLMDFCKSRRVRKVKDGN